MRSLPYSGTVAKTSESLDGRDDPCRVLLADDLGWGLGTIFRAYVAAANAAVADLPGGPRGYQILAAAARGNVASQLALGQLLGVDRTVMTYLLDDLESADLIARRADPADRRTRRIVATANGAHRLRDLDERLRSVEARLLASLEVSERASFRAMIQLVATRIDDADLPLEPCDTSSESTPAVSTLRARTSRH